MKTIRAVYQDGVFKPSEPVQLAAGTAVEVLLPETLEDKMARLEARFPNSFGVLAAEDAIDIERAIDKQRSLIDPVDPFPDNPDES